MRWELPNWRRPFKNRLNPRKRYSGAVNAYDDVSCYANIRCDLEKVILYRQISPKVALSDSKTVVLNLFLFAELKNPAYSHLDDQRQSFRESYLIK